jgi:hypothetical protein
VATVVLERRDEKTPLRIVIIEHADPLGGMLAFAWQNLWEPARDGGLAGNINVECYGLIASKLVPTVNFFSLDESDP